MEFPNIIQADPNDSKIQLESRQDLTFLQSELLNSLNGYHNKAAKESPSKKKENAKEKKGAMFVSPPCTSDDLRQFVERVIEVVKCNIQIAGKDVNSQDDVVIQEDVDEALAERIEQAEGILFETMRKVVEKRQNIDNSINHALTKQLEEYSTHLHDNVKSEKENHVDVNAQVLSEQTLNTLDMAVKNTKDRLESLPEVIARLERAKTVILDEEERKKHGSSSHQGKGNKVMNSKQRRVSKQFDLANKLSLY